MIKEYVKDGYLFSRHLKIKNSDFRIYVLYEKDSSGRYRMFTDDLKYGEHLEIFYDNKQQMYTIKNLDSLRAEWRKNHPGENVIDNVIENFVEVNL